MAAMTRAGEMYLDLLKKSLTNTIFAIEPNAEDASAKYVSSAIAHYQQSDAVSMLPLARMNNLQECISCVLAEGIPGDLIETGVWRGGATIFMRAVLKVLDVSDRVVWVADSFEGLPQPDAEAHPLEAAAFESAAMKKYYNRLAVGLDEVKRNFASYGLLDEQVSFIKGWFKETLPNAPVGQLSVMRLDGDFYESTRDALRYLYDKLSPGGYVIVDDYGEDSWTYCRKAVDEFRESLRIDSPLVRVDRPCVYWRKPV